MLLLLVAWLVSSVFYYVDGFRTGLSAKKWAVAGLLFGPLLFPMFSITQRIKLSHAQGFDYGVFAA